MIKKSTMAMVAIAGLFLSSSIYAATDEPTIDPNSGNGSNTVTQDSTTSNTGTTTTADQSVDTPDPSKDPAAITTPTTKEQKAPEDIKGPKGLMKSDSRTITKPDTKSN